MKQLLRLAMALAIAAPLVFGLALDTLAAGAPAGLLRAGAAAGILLETHDDKLDENDDEDGEDSPDGDDPVTYVLPTFGVAFEYEAQVWAVEDEIDAANNGGRDIVQLGAQSVGAVLYVEATDKMTDSDDCVEVMIGEMQGIVGDDYDISEIDVSLSDVPDSESAAFVADPEDVIEDDPRALAVVVECREFEGGEGVVAFTLMANESELEETLEFLEPIRESVEFDVDPDAATGGDEDSSGEITIYEGSTYDFSYTYDPSTWDILEQESTTSEDWIMFRGPHGSNLGFSVQEARSTSLSCVIGYAEEFEDLHPDVELYEDPDTGEPIQFSNRTEAYALYTMTHDERGPLFVYIHCAESPDGDAMIVLSGLAPQDELEFVIDEMMPVVDRIEF